MRASSRAVVLEEFERDVAMRELDVPDPEPGAVVARVDYGGVCGTDVHLRHGRLPIPVPVVLGHEAVGRVEALGEGLDRDALGRPLAQGDRIGWSSSIACNRCYYCLVEQARTLCTDRVVYGINQSAEEWPHLSGGWAEAIYLRPRTTVVRIPEEVSSEQVIALGCAGPTVAHGMARLGPVPAGGVVAVQGSGPVGLAAGMAARLRGAGRVLMLGAPANRLRLATELRVADLVVDITEITEPAERVERVLAETEGGRGADVVVEATGVPSAVAEGIDMCRPDGRYLVLGQYTDQGSTPLNPHRLVARQLALTTAWGFDPSDYVGFLRSLPALTARFDLARLVSVYPLGRAKDALSDVAAGTVTKAALAPGH
ncbi:MAG: zinc-binding dehydrogenase [Actinomycetota bacterium]|nr:zinc-binding dehydrogenase [Actinomycetota bacterium]